MQVEDVNDADGIGVTLKAVTAGMPADKAGLKAGDVILKIDGKMMTAAMRLNDITLQHKPGDVLTLVIKGKEKDKDRDVKVSLAEDTGTVGKGKGKGLKGGGGGNFGWDTRATAPGAREPIASPSSASSTPMSSTTKRSPRRAGKKPSSAPRTYTATSVTGQKVHGSLNDYYQEQSFEKLKVEGKVFECVTVSKKRSEYAQANTGPGKTALLGEALDKLLARDGKDALEGLRRRLLPLRRRPRADDSRRPLLAAPGERHATRASVAVLHRPGGRRRG